ncbi:TPA: hypothetical protein UZ441_002374 [Escherichia coli]|uniref:Uncharacterized protein n=1 Tax=Escherichia coli TA447 TaxID=656447 RepID=A0A1X3J3K9_ECOLX|nr:hypothetical protein [Escherichia coli]MCX1968899.1 hypothetical protein [Escherichia coli]MUN04355.1 hypothetical protein [Escherichia coli]OSK95290.1 hypothetical protein ECXG_01831 [Escherichia coli TA447]HBN1791235.1 hypothetical protein [Escherichia coli]HEL8024370.1 hypothetical protein [Escherichia coli]
MATTTKNMVEIASAYTLIIHRLIDNNARDALNTIKPLSEAKSDIIRGLKSLQECARYAGDHAAYMAINDAIERIESGKPLRDFV